jgi:hypothetical protein
LVGGKGFARMGPSHGKTSGSIKIGTFISAQLAKC